jgi:hypothetical protein
MERAEWLLLMTVKCKLLGCGFTMAISSSPVSGGFVPKLLHFNSLCRPATWAFGAVESSELLAFTRSKGQRN